ncbi:MAG: hypothetical protein QXD51_00050 [Candidatus Anstonellales archaeon]
MHKKILAVLLMLFIIPIFYAEQKEEQTTQCYGDMDLTIDVNNKKIVAKVSGLENCIGEINITEGSCEGKVACSFELSQGECYFNIPSIGTHEYFACLDMNEDGEYTSDETDYEKVVVAPYEEGDEDEGGGFSWDIIIPIGLFAFILFIIAFPLLNETIKKKKSGKKRRK